MACWLDSSSNTVWMNEHDVFYSWRSPVIIDNYSNIKTSIKLESLITSDTRVQSLWAERKAFVCRPQNWWERLQWRTATGSKAFIWHSDHVCISVNKTTHENQQHLLCICIMHAYSLYICAAKSGTVWRESPVSFTQQSFAKNKAVIPDLCAFSYRIQSSLP